LRFQQPERPLLERVKLIKQAGIFGANLPNVFFSKDAALSCDFGCGLDPLRVI